MLNIYRLSDCEQWDSIVKSFAEYDVYYLSGYVKAFQIHGDGEPLLFYYCDENIKAINVVMKRDIAQDIHLVDCIKPGTHYDFATPYGYGGWLIEGSGDCQQLFDTYEKWCMEHNVVSEFVRFHPVLKTQEYSLKSYDVIPLGETVTVDLSSEENIWNNITSKNRNMIRKAQKNNLTVLHGKSKELFETFREIYNLTMDKDEADAYYYFSETFYESILNDLEENAEIFYVVYEGKVIAAAIMLMANGRINYHLSGSLIEYKHLAATNLLLYETAIWGYRNGYKTFYLGGGVGSGEDGLFKFKRSFYRGDLKRFYIGKKIFMQDKYNSLLEIRGSVENKNFFPQYRA